MLSFWCRAREALRQCLPDQLKDTTFAQVLKDDTTTKRWLAQLVKNLQEGQVTDPRGIPLPPQWSSFPLTAPLCWGVRVEPMRKTAQVLLLGIDNLSAELYWRKGARYPLRCVGWLEVLDPPTAPRNWAPDSSLLPQPQAGVNTSKCCVCSMPKMTLLLNLYLATGRERRERGNGSNTLGMRAPGTKPCGFFFFFLNFAFLDNLRCVS